MQALAPAGIILLALMIYTGFALPISRLTNRLGLLEYLPLMCSSMGVWFRWINYLDPIAYAFESLMVNEFSDRSFPCSTFVPQGPGYDNVGPLSRICSTVGAAAGGSSVDGNAYLALSFQYYRSHLWRNLGIIYAFVVFFLCTYLTATEFISAKKSKGEVLLFRRGQTRETFPGTRSDIETAAIRETDVSEKDATLGREVSAVIQRQEEIFHWKDVCFDIKVKGGERRLLDHVDGWVKRELPVIGAAPLLTKSFGSWAIDCAHGRVWRRKDYTDGRFGCTYHNWSRLRRDAG